MFDLSPEARNRKQQPVELPFKFMKASPNAYGACLLNKTPQLAARTLAHTHTGPVSREFNLFTA